MNLKHSKKNLSLLLACSLTLSPAYVSSISHVVTPGLDEVSATKAPSKAKKKKGWQTTKLGKKRYYRKGKFVTGLQMIRKNTYYFDKQGFLKTGTVKHKKTTYYLDSKGVLEASKVRSTYYYANGRKMNAVDANDFRTLQTAKSVVSQITTSRMTQSEKLKRCFDWVMAKPYINRRVFSNTKGWLTVYANDHFLLGGGNCFADAAAFAYLAKAIGYKNVYVCVDCDGSGGRGHGWAEINGLVYDPLFAQAKSYSGNYGVPYGTYPLYAILHIPL